MAPGMTAPGIGEITRPTTRKTAVQTTQKSRTKNEDDRMIPIRPSLAKTLRSLYDHYLAEGGLPEFVMPLNKAGSPMTTFIGAWKRLQKRCGLRQLSIHSLRHACASHMVMQEYHSCQSRGS